MKATVTPQQQLEAMCRHIVHAIVQALPVKVAVTVILADFGEAGNLAYMSTGERESMIATMKEMIAHLEGRSHDTAGHA